MTDKLYNVIDEFDPTLPQPFAGFATRCIQRKANDVRYELARYHRLYRSLQAPAEGEDADGKTVGDLIADPTSVDPATLVKGDPADRWRVAFDQVVTPLTHWQRAVVRMRLAEDQSFASIGIANGLHAQAVFHTFNTAMDVIRDAFTVDELHDLLGVAGGGGGAVSYAQINQARQAAARPPAAVGHRPAAGEGGAGPAAAAGVQDAVLVLDRRDGQ